MKQFLTIVTLLIIVLKLNAQVTISGTVKNYYNDSVFYITETGGFHNITGAWRDNRVKVVIDNNNHFKVMVPEESIGSWYIKTENGNQFFDIVKDKNLELIVDFYLAKPLLAIGENTDDFNYSIYIKDSVPDDTYKKYRGGVKSKNVDSILMCRKEYSLFQKKILKQYKNTHQMSDIYFNWLNSKYTYEPFERTLVENIESRDSLDDKTISKIMELGIHDEYAALNTVEYNDLIYFYTSTKITKKTNKGLTINDRFNFVADNNILTGNTKDIYLSRLMSLLIKVPDSVYNPLFKKYDEAVRDEKMKQYVVDRRNDYVKPLATSIIDKTRVSSIIEIFKKHQGKVIYVDFWASWCGPCRGEMPNAALLKNKLKGKDIVFIYFGYNDKEKAWLKARNQLGIEGEHYLLNEKMIKEADELFGINSIPHYAIIDKESSIVSKRADRPSDVYEQLLKLVEK